jgi:hypothetical protein
MIFELVPPTIKKSPGLIQTGAFNLQGAICAAQLRL